MSMTVTRHQREYLRQRRYHLPLQLARARRRLRQLECEAVRLDMAGLIAPAALDEVQA